MYYLGYMYSLGLGGLPEDKEQAVYWYRKAADASAMSVLAGYYLCGRGGLPEDKEQAVYWYRKAAQLGDVFAQDIITRMA